MAAHFHLQTVMIGRVPQHPLHDVCCTFHPTNNRLSTVEALDSAGNQELFDVMDLFSDVVSTTDGGSSAAGTSLFGEDDFDNLMCLVWEERPRLERTAACTVCAPGVKACRTDAKKQTVYWWAAARDLQESIQNALTIPCSYV